jgi:hypothetical protein
MVDYDLKTIKCFSGKELNKFLLEILKSHYSSNMLFDDSKFIATIIKGLGNIVNMKMLSETLNEIIRQGKVDLARSMSLLDQVMGSHNNLIIKGCIEALTTMHENLSILYAQMIKNSEQRKKHRDENKENKKIQNPKQMNKVQMEVDAKKRIKRHLPQIESFMESITGFSIYDNILDIQVLYFRYQIVKLFTKDK